MFDISNQTISVQHSVELNRQGIGLNAVNCFLFMIVFFKTLSNSRMPLLLVVSSLMALGYFISTFTCAMYNWVDHGQLIKNITYEEKVHINYFYAWFSAAGALCNLWGQWIYIWGYWKVANLLHSLENEQPPTKPCIENLLCSVVGILLFINYTLAAWTRQEYKYDPKNKVPS